ncbi:2-phosphosulfolactate phosphatase [bacterium]|nr:2-phosphosulfolactate phosphatase [bacterium]
MSREVRVHLLPVLFEPEEVRGGIAVILDILRASTTITHALAHGAKCVIPTLDVEASHQLKSEYSPGTAITGGEREGLLIPGFDYDNNPFAYTADVVKNKTIIFTTTNGTKALHRASQADRVLIGSFVNLSAVVSVLVQNLRPVHLVCAGTKGKITVEDALCAGAIAQELATASKISTEDWTDDQLQLAVRLYRDAISTPDGFLAAMRNSFGGRNCRRLGFDDQLERAATRDLFSIVPEYHADTGQITLSN